jgi:hypothetical protein
MPNANYIVEGLDLAHRLNYHRPELQTLAYYFSRGDLKRSQTELLVSMLRPVYAMAREHPEMALFDLPHTLTGELEIGQLPNQKACNLGLSVLATGTLIVGTTGSGKSTLLLGLVDSVAAHLAATHQEGGIWVTDHQKADMEAAITIANQYGLRMAVAPPDLPFNPLETPPGVPTRSWAAKAHSLITFALQLPEITSLYLRPVMSGLYAQTSCPTWNDLIRAVDDTKEMPESVRKPLALKLKGIASDLRGLADVRHGFPIEELEKRLVYWPLYQLPRDHARLLYSWARWASYTRRIENRIRRSAPDLVVIEDEIAFAYNDGSGNDFISMLCAVQRSTGIAFIGANQSFSLLPQILANTNVKIVGRLASMPDVREASDLLTLSSDQRDWLLLQPQPGQFLIKLPSGHLQPFPFRARQPEFRTLSEQERVQVERILHDELGGFVVREAVVTVPEEEADSVPVPETRVSENERALLENCYADPFLFHTQRARNCGFNNNAMNQTKKALLKKGFIVEHELDTCKPGARPKLAEITDAGCELLGKPAPCWKGRLGGFLHHYGKHLAATYFASLGFETQIEHALGNGLSADVLARRAEETVAVEVQVSEEHARENLAKLSGKVTRVEFLCFRARVKKRLEELTKSTPGARANHFSHYLLPAKDLHGF